MSISVYTHIHPSTETPVTLHEGEDGKYVVLSAGRLSVFIDNREKTMEIASMLDKAAQEWEEDAGNCEVIKGGDL